MRKRCSIQKQPGRQSLLVLLCCSSSFIFGVQTVVIPPSRWGHISVLCGQTLYVHGGHTGMNPISAPIGSDLYSLDISSAFNAFSVPWVQLSAGPYATYHSASLSGAENSLLGIYGGNTSFSGTGTGSSSSLNLYNTITNQWSTAPSQIQDPPRREQHTAVTRYGDGTMFVFGGLILSQDLLSETPTSEIWSLGGYPPAPITPPLTNSTNTTTAAPQPQPTLVSLPVGLSPGTVGWQQLKSPSNPMLGSLLSTSDRSYHTATIIRSSGLIVVIGGVSSGVLVPMSEIWVYDTGAGTWSVQQAAGAIPPQRRSHVAAASNNGQIYVHGGTDVGATTYFADLAILDTTSWTWNQPAIGGSPPTGRYSHAATMIGSNLIVSFGLSAGGASNSLYILDTNANNWVTSYTPNNLSLTSTRPVDWPGYTPPPPLPSPSNNGTDPNHPGNQSSSSIVGPVIGGLVGAVAIAALAMVAIRRHRRHQEITVFDGRQRPSSKVVGLYGPGMGINSADYRTNSQGSLDDPYRHTGMAFSTGRGGGVEGGSSSGGSRPSSIGSRMEQFWITSSAFLAGGFLGRNQKDRDRAQSQRLRDHLDENEEDESDRSSWRGLQMGPAISDQDIFLDAVHRARSRTGFSPVFAPLQQPIASSSPPLSPRSPRMTSGLIHSHTGQDSGAGVKSPEAMQAEYEDEEGASSGPHGRAYSDGFENKMLEMDVQMLAVPRGRLYVVNPTDEPTHP